MQSLAWEPPRAKKQKAQPDNGPTYPGPVLVLAAWSPRCHHLLSGRAEAGLATRLPQPLQGTQGGRGQDPFPSIPDGLRQGGPTTAARAQAPNTALWPLPQGLEGDPNRAGSGGRLAGWTAMLSTA